MIHRLSSSSLVTRCCYSLFNSSRNLTTDSAATKQLTTKNVRRPKIAAEVWKRERARKQRVNRGRDLFAKEAHVKATMASVSSARDVVMVQLADQIFSKGHTHIATATNVSFVPDGNPATPLVALAGRGRVGKTSLLRSLFRSPAQVSKSNRVLRRDAVNYFNVGDVFNVADLPGYGGTSVPWSTVLQHAVLLRNFVRFQPSLKMLYYCMDVHYKNGVYVQDMDMLKFLSQEVPNFTIVITKGDQINDSDHSHATMRMEDVRRELAHNDILHPVLVTSAYKMGGVDTLRFDMVMNAVHALPTERLTFTEAKKLSARLFSQKELGTVRHLAIAPTQLDDDVREWKLELAQELASGSVVESEDGDNMGHLERSDEHTSQLDDVALVNEADERLPDSTNDEAAVTGPTESDLTMEEETLPFRSGTGAFDVTQQEVDEILQQATVPSVHGGDNGATTTTTAAAPEAGRSLPTTVPGHFDLAPLAPSKHIPVVFPDEPDRQAAYVSLVKKAENRELLAYVRQTSPWRNPLHWPRHVIPTKHPKSNIMRCPEDPENPYLTQAQFVAPRADMCFRRPNVGCRRSSQKGRYEPDKPLQYLLRAYTVPYFPDIVDTNMHPEPWTFLGSREAFFEKGGGRQLGVRLSLQAREGEVNALSSNPAPENPQLTEEVRVLERKRYGAPIAMLRPPDPAEEEVPKALADGQRKEE